MLLVGCIVDIALVPVCMCSSMVGVGTSVAVGDVCCSAFCCWHCWSCCGGVMVVVIAVVDVTVVMVMVMLMLMFGRVLLLCSCGCWCCCCCWYGCIVRRAL